MISASPRYASHLPVLTDLLLTEKPCSVLEFGGGIHSTPLFLAHVDRLVTVETDPGWQAHLRLAYPKAEVVVTAPPLSGFDLVFIDDGGTAKDRLATIEHVLGRPHPLVVIHDAEVPVYRDAIERLAGDWMIFDTDPDTCVVRP